MMMKLTTTAETPNILSNPSEDQHSQKIKIKTTSTIVIRQIILILKMINLKTFRKVNSSHPIGIKQIKGIVCQRFNRGRMKAKIH